MKDVILENPLPSRGIDINEFPVSEAAVDSNGNYKLNTETNQFETTGETHDWSLKAGTRALFKQYVAKVLTENYHFITLICVDCHKEFKFEALDSSYKTAYENYKTHELYDCNQTNDANPTHLEGVEDTENGSDVNNIIDPLDNFKVPEMALNSDESKYKTCPICKDGKEYLIHQLGMHFASKHPENFLEAIKN